MSTVGTKLELYLISIDLIPKPSNAPALLPSLPLKPPMFDQSVVAYDFCNAGSNLPVVLLYFKFVDMK